MQGFLHNNLPVGLHTPRVPPRHAPAPDCRERRCAMCLQTEREPLEAAAKSQAYEEVPKPSPDDVLVGHPDSLDAFWKAHPEFLWGPCVLGALVKGGTMIPGVAAYLDAHGMEPYGFLNALHYTAFALILSCERLSDPACPRETLGSRMPADACSVCAGRGAAVRASTDR